MKPPSEPRKAIKPKPAKRPLSSSNPIMRSVLAFFAEEQAARERPATDEQLSQIWPAFNELPAEMLPEEKRRILCTEHVEQNPVHREHLKKLGRHFPHLRLCKHEYNHAWETAVTWSNLVRYVQTTFQIHQDLVSRQCAFAEADNHASGRIAIFRAAKEIELTHPGLLQSTSPTLAQIAILVARYTAYTLAREQALAALANLVFKVPGIRTGRTLPIEERAVGVPHPPDDVPRYLFIARLDALGICSADRLAEFLHYAMPHLERSKRQKFDRMRRKPRFGKEPYAGFLVWVLDNRPIFEHEGFGWQWKDILKAAEERHIDSPKTCLKQWAYRSRVHLKVKRGQPSGDARDLYRSAKLLSPAPVFGDVLKADPR